jgi:peptide methionine sulfoxide reductase msrA/msrB
VSSLLVENTEEAILAAGCFWGVEYFFQQLPGVVKTEVGYTGGNDPNPSYERVCQGNNGHFEAVRVVYYPKKISFEAIIKYFFEIHDPTQKNGQGPDIGQQYQSAIFYSDKLQRQIAENVIAQLEQSDNKITTQLLPVSIFWSAETYHQNYYKKSGKQPYCHRYTKRF